MNTLLESRNLTKNFQIGKDNEITVLRGVDLHIAGGEFVSVMGPSGSGKSTLLYNICGMDRMTSGEVTFNGRELAGLSEPELARLRLTEMGFIFQQIHLLRNLSIFDNIVLSGYLANGRSRSEVNAAARELMQRTGIAELADNAITQASGGQLQRVGICRALINNPEIIFGDEPTGALNSRASAEIMDLLSEVNRSGTTVMLVTHDVRVAARTNRVLLMMDGEVVSEKALGAMTDPGEITAREEELSAWLLEMGV
ncbi:MAG: ABC transporter ATP-binding protein [Spirochaeta sp.]|jgi:putative ABC transport system ATP-binding protein|nr:ABC transporter ATP-binding protein [Spirochaeta sp.]